MPKTVRLSGMMIATPRAVQVNLADAGSFSLSPKSARKLAACLEEGPDAVEAIVFLLRQGADAIEAQQAHKDAVHEAWLKTQPHRP